MATEDATVTAQPMASTVGPSATGLGDTRTVASRVAGRFIFALSLAAFIAALRLTYAEFMAPRFGYLGYQYHDPSPEWMIVSYLMLLAVSGFLPYRTTRISGFAVWFLYTALLVPVATVPLFGSERDPADSFTFALYCAAIWVGIALIIRRVPALVIPLRKAGANYFWLLIVSLSVVTYGYVEYFFGLNLNVMSVFEVYDTRLLYRDEVAPTVPILGYLVSNQGNVVNPLLIALGIVRRRWVLLIIGTVGQLILYSTTGYKTSLISIPLCIAIAFILRYRRSLAGLSILTVATALVWASIAMDSIRWLGLVDIFVNRIFITAGYLIPHYRDVYENAPWALWDYSFLAPFVDTPYQTSPGYYVASVLFGRPDIQLNAALFADGYANLGYVGIALEAVALVGILVLVDSASRGLPLAVTLPAALLPVFSLANGSPFTAFLSHGFALLVVSLALLPRDEVLPLPKARGTLRGDDHGPPARRLAAPAVSLVSNYGPDSEAGSPARGPRRPPK